jgi:hypothetical protein
LRPNIGSTGGGTLLATYTGMSSDFIVANAYWVLVEERLGTAGNQTRYEGTHSTSGVGHVWISTLSGATWSLEEVR